MRINKSISMSCRVTLSNLNDVLFNKVQSALLGAVIMSYANHTIMAGRLLDRSRLVKHHRLDYHCSIHSRTLVRLAFICNAMKHAVL